MRFLHTADWHIGRRLHGYDLTAAQQNAFDQIRQIALTQQVDGVIIAGDLYDRGMPAEASVTLLDQMIQKLNLADKLPIYAISGNHDSGVRLGTGAPWYSATNFHMATTLAAALQPVELQDTQIFLLPYFEPFAVRQFFEDETIQHLDQAVARMVAEMKKQFDPAKKHVLVAHFFVSGSDKTDSETPLTVGGLAAVSAETLTDFDYVALGHLHGHNALQRPNMRYSGSPVKFSLSEATQQKGVYIVDTDPFQLLFIPLNPLRDVQQLTASFETFMDPAYYQKVTRDNYLGLVLTDQKPIPNVMTRLSEIYPHIINLERANGYTVVNPAQVQNLKRQDPLTILQDFYQETAHEDMTPQQLKWAQQALEAARKETD